MHYKLENRPITLCLINPIVCFIITDICDFEILIVVAGWDKPGSGLSFFFTDINYTGLSE